MVQHLVRLRARPRDQAEFGPADSTLGASRKRSCPGSILVQYVLHSLHFRIGIVCSRRSAQRNGSKPAVHVRIRGQARWLLPRGRASGRRRVPELMKDSDRGF